LQTVIDQIKISPLGLAFNAADGVAVSVAAARYAQA